MNFEILYFICSFVIIGAMVAGSTTVISRLLSGTKVNVWYKESICSECNQVIPMKEQIPFFTYLKNRGRCCNCKTNFGNRDFLVELITLIVLGIAYLISYQTIYVGLILSVFYLVEMFVLILVFHKREKKFGINLCYSVVFSVVMLSMLSVVKFICDKTI